MIFTNGSVPHAQRVTKQLGIDHLFEGIFDIVAAKFVPKPNPTIYELMVNKYRVDTQTSVMIDDMAKNLIPAANLGISTSGSDTTKNGPLKIFQPNTLMKK